MHRQEEGGGGRGRKAKARRLAELEEKMVKKPDKKVSRVVIPVSKVTEAEPRKRREEEAATMEKKSEESKKKQTRTTADEEYERMVLVSKNRDDLVIEARSVEEDIAQMTVAESLPVDRHLEKRLKALFNMGDHGSRNIDVKALEQSLKAKLCGDSPMSAKCCIFRVPELLRRHKPEAYNPDIVSIGPYHHGSGNLFEPMEKVKRWYLNSLLLRCRTSLRALIQGIDKITGFEKRSRDYYAESLAHLNRNEFIEMMIIDGCFLLELFQRQKYIYPETVNDPLSNMTCMVQYVSHDLLLLENQLPWFVLESLYSLICNNQVPLTTLVLNFFSRLSSMSKYCEDYSNHPHDEEILHILDLIRSAIVVPFRKFESTEFKYALPHATALVEAGIQFRRSSVDGLMSIDFKDGVLTIPQLAIAELTEPLFRNLIAFEQCYHGREHKVASYALLMDNLISSSKDVVYLCDKKIIYNWLSAEEVSQLFSKLHSDTFVTVFCYGELCAEVNKYYEARWNKWLARLKRDYLSNPWKITSLVAAFILLVLTLLQTTYTIQQYYHPRQ